MALDDFPAIPAFPTALRGYDREATDAFLRKLEEAFSGLIKQRNELRAEVEKANGRVTELEAEVADHRKKTQAVGDALITAQELADRARARANVEREEILRGVEGARDEARRHADAIRADASRQAAEIIREAQVTAERLIVEARSGIEQRRLEAESFLDDTRERLGSLVRDLIGRVGGAGERDGQDGQAPVELPPLLPVETPPETPPAIQD